MPESRIRRRITSYNVCYTKLWIAVGYHIRDKVWERSGGRLYVDFRPLAQLGGEKDVIAKVKLGAVQGMLCSSVAAVNVSDKLGIVNLV